MMMKILKKKMSIIISYLLTYFKKKKYINIIKKNQLNIP